MGIPCTTELPYKEVSQEVQGILSPPPEQMSGASILAATLHYVLPPAHLLHRLPVVVSQYLVGPPFVKRFNIIIWCCRGMKPTTRSAPAKQIERIGLFVSQIRPGKPSAVDLMVWLAKLLTIPPLE